MEYSKKKSLLLVDEEYIPGSHGGPCDTPRVFPVESETLNTHSHWAVTLSALKETTTATTDIREGEGGKRREQRVKDESHRVFLLLLQLCV